MVEQIRIEFPKLSESEALRALVNAPLSLSVSRALNSVGTMSIRYPFLAVQELFSQDGKVKLPESAQLKVTDSEKEESCLFRGVMESYRVRKFGSERFVEVGFSDPLVATHEISEPVLAQKKSLKEVVDQLLQNGGAGSLGLKSVFKGEVPEPPSLTTLGRSDFDFFLEVAHGKYGFYFYFNPKKESSEEVVFFQPSESGGEIINVPSIELDRMGYDFIGSFNQFPTEVVFHNDKKSHPVKCDEVSSDFSDFFKVKEEIRSGNGVNKRNHYYFPNEKNDFCASAVKNRLILESFNGDCLRFSCSKVLQVGDWVKIDDESQRFPKHMAGKYLISRVQFQSVEDEWMNSYLGVRP